MRDGCTVTNLDLCEISPQPPLTNSLLYQSHRKIYWNGSRVSHKSLKSANTHVDEFASSWRSSPTRTRTGTAIMIISSTLCSFATHTGWPTVCKFPSRTDWGALLQCNGEIGDQPRSCALVTFQWLTKVSRWRMVHAEVAISEQIMTIEKETRDGMRILYNFGFPS